jgi:hypothetical protein
MSMSTAAGAEIIDKKGFEQNLEMFKSHPEMLEPDFAFDEYILQQ